MMELDIDALIAVGPQIDREQAYQAHYSTSFSPDVRADQEVAGAIAHLKAVYADLLPLATTPEQHDLLAAELGRYQAGFIPRKHAQLAAQSRTASAMITGAARFPTARNQKRLATEQKRSDELADWSRRAQQAMRKTLLAARSPEQVDDDAWVVVKRAIDEDMAMVRAIDAGEARWRGFSRLPFVTSSVGKIRRLANNGDVALAARALAYVRERQAGMAKPFISERHGVWRVAEREVAVATGGGR